MPMNMLHTSNDSLDPKIWYNLETKIILQLKKNKNTCLGVPNFKESFQIKAIYKKKKIKKKKKNKKKKKKKKKINIKNFNKIKKKKKNRMKKHKYIIHIWRSRI